MFYINTYFKRITICIVLFFFTIHIVYSQNYINTPNDTIFMTGALDDLQTLSIHQENISLDTIYIKWKKIAALVPDSWEASNCDNSICYTTLEDSGSMLPIYPADYGFLLLHITPHVMAGTSIIRYSLQDTTSNIIDTLTYILQVNATSLVNENNSNNSIHLYPNPSDNKLFIHTQEDNFEYTIIDYSGKIIFKNQALTNQLIIDTQHYNSGNYLIHILSNLHNYFLKFSIQH